jgi:hypothetical protein
MVDHELEFGWLKCGRQANAVVADDGRMLVVTRFADGTLAAIWEPGGDPRTMPDQRVICLQSSENYELTERLQQVIAELDAARQALIRMSNKGKPCTDQTCTSRRMLDRLHERLDRERVPALDVADRWRAMNVEERLEALFAGWESSKAQALTEFKQQVDRDVDKFLAGFAWKEPKDG